MTQKYVFSTILIALAFLTDTSVLADSEHYPIRMLDGPSMIVGGDPAQKGDYPWFVGSAGCGASLVAPEWILTAAHCNQFINSVTIGKLCNSGDNCGQAKENFNIQKKVKHPQYNDRTLSHDFSLMKINGKSKTKPVPMDTGNISPNYKGGEKVWAIGFGALKEGGGSPSKLMHVEVSYVTQQQCKAAYGQNSIDDSMMCAADPGEDACQGDSGGPLYDKNKNRLVGVVSWGIGCANRNYPGVYSRISDEYAWIKQTVCADHSNPKPSYCSDDGDDNIGDDNVGDDNDFNDQIDDQPALDYHSFKNIKTSGGKSWCMKAQNMSSGSNIVIGECSRSDKKQQFKVDSDGLFRFYNDESKCLKKFRNTIKVGTCGKSSLFKFTYSYFEDQIIWTQKGLGFVLTVAGDSVSDGKRVELKKRNTSLKTQGWYLG